MNIRQSAIRRGVGPSCRLFAVLGLLALGTSSGATAQPEGEPVWPARDVVAEVSGLLGELYSQRASASTPAYYLAPEWESDKWRASKDPDTLWEYGVGQSARCHSAVDDRAFLDCAAARLASAAGIPNPVSPDLFDAAAGFGPNAQLVQLAARAALYHAYVHDFDARLPDAYQPSEARDAQRYHERMIRAYETLMRQILLRMFRDTRSDPAFQLELTLGLGRLALGYLRTLQAVETYGAWARPADRRNAIALVNGINQRLWWEWVYPQSDGPRTAGFVDLGSQVTQQAAAATGPRWVGTDQFVYDGAIVPSLRPAELDKGRYAGIWVDADYGISGEWWCYARYASASPSLGKCLAQARKTALGGSKSPFGQYYGDPGATGCATRASNVTTQSCGLPNRGSIATDWVEAHLGARLGMFVIRELALGNDPDLPDGAIGPRELDIVTDRLGYGVAGWHGGSGQHDDLEWSWATTAPVVAIRTLSAGRHDLEPQDGRFSLGETDASPVAAARRGDTWAEDRQEFPGGVERQAPGPSPRFGPELFALVLSDRISAGLAGSWFDARSRDEPDEFAVWIWLFLSGFYRCDSDDPADGACFAFSTAHWPYPSAIRRWSLFTAPSEPVADARFRYLWRNPTTDNGPAIAEGNIAERDMSCQSGGGLPWQHVADWTTLGDSGYLVDEAGGGAYDSLLMAYGGLIRLIAARFAVAAPEATLAAEYDLARREVLAPWYEESVRQLRALLALYRQTPPAGFRYVPSVENSTCIGFDPYVPSDPSLKMVLSWQAGTSSTVQAAAARRAIGYARLAEWYWWLSDDWLLIDQATW